MHNLLARTTPSLVYTRTRSTDSLSQMLQMDPRRQYLLEVRRDGVPKDGRRQLWLVLVALGLLQLSDVCCAPFPL
jgi:hypothetical protein